MFGVAVIIFLLGWTALARERLSAINFSFFILTTSVAWWLGTTAMVMMSLNELDAEVWARITYVGVCSIPAAVLQFSLALVDRVRERARTLVVAWVAAATFASLFFTTDGFITGVYRYKWGFYTRLGTASIVFLVFFCGLLAATVMILRAHDRQTLTDQQKKRIGAFLTAITVGYVASVDFLPSFGVAIYPIGYIAVLGSTILCIRAIWRYSFDDLTPGCLVDSLVENVHGGVLVVDMHGTIRIANPAAAGLLGSAPEKLVGTSLEDVAGAEQFSALADISFSATVLRDRQQMPVGTMYVLRDLSERRRVERQEFAANHDVLTGLPNRAYFAHRFGPAVREIAGHGRNAAVLFVDLDGFKEINDQHGHVTGDRLLQLVAARLRNALRDDDVVARHGGDEFVALVGLRSPDDAVIVAKKLMGVLRREPFVVDQLSLTVSASVGTAMAGRDGLQMEEVIRAADEAMYRAKRQTKGETPERRPRTDAAVAPPFQIESRA